jgi:hypothetical protein
MLGVRPAERTAPAALTRPVRQQAPPTAPAAAQADTPSRTVGPVALGEGSLISQARWNPAMACGEATGEITRARAVLNHVDLLADSSGRALLRVPRRLEARSTTALQRRGPAVHTVARSGVTVGTVELLDGAVRVTVLKPPTLSTSISAAGAADIRYVPAVLEVSSPGIGTARLATPGDETEIDLGAPAGGDTTEADTTRSKPAVGGRADTDRADNDRADTDRADNDRADNNSADGDPAGQERTGDAPATEAASGADGAPTTPADPLRRLLEGLPDGALRGVTSGVPLSLPVPRVETAGAPQLTRGGRPDGGQADGGARRPETTGPDNPAPESAGPGGDRRSTLRVSIGEVRQAVRGHAVAARAAAIRVRLTVGAATGPRAGGKAAAGGTVLDLDIGILEAAAVAPEPDGAAGGTTTGGTQLAAGTAAGLPVTGSQVDSTVVAGAVLLAGGILFLVIGLRRRSFHA